MTRLKRAYEEYLLRQVTNSPRHVAIIQDGNRRYAEKAGIKQEAGHRRGAATTERVLNWAKEIGIEELTVYTFSTENFNRPAEEVSYLFDLIEEKLYEFADSDQVHDNHVAIQVIGDRAQLPTSVQQAVDYAEQRTGQYDEVTLNVALAYGGRTTLLSAARDIADKAQSGDLSPDKVDTDTVREHLYDHPVSEVDLVIRTGGEVRTSNFLPWCAAGSEAAVYFCSTYWPGFSKREFLRGIQEYEAQQESWRKRQAQRAQALLRGLSNTGRPTTRETSRHRKRIFASDEDITDVSDTAD